MRDFEMELTRKWKGKGAARLPRVGYWIRHHLLECGGDYVYSMWDQYTTFVNNAKKIYRCKIPAITKTNFNRYIWLLKKVGIIFNTNQPPHQFDRAAAVVSSMNYYPKSSAGASWEAGLVSTNSHVIDSIIQATLSRIPS